jgi:hypothetical protein
MREPSLQDTAPYPVSQRYGIEVDQQPNVAGTEPQIGQELRFVQRQNAFDRLEFENHLIVHDDVGDVAAVKQDIVVAYWKRHLATERYRGAADLVAETQFIDRLEQTGSKATVHAHGEADDLVRKVAAMGEAGLHGAQPVVGLLAESLIALLFAADTKKARITRIWARITRRRVFGRFAPESRTILREAHSMLSV